MMNQHRRQTRSLQESFGWREGRAGQEKWQGRTAQQHPQCKVEPIARFFFHRVKVFEPGDGRNVGSSGGVFVQQTCTFSKEESAASGQVCHEVRRFSLISRCVLCNCVVTSHWESGVGAAGDLHGPRGCDIRARDGT